MIKQTGPDFQYEVKNYYRSLRNYNEIILIRLYRGKLKQSVYRPVIGSGSEVPKVSDFRFLDSLQVKVVRLSVFAPAAFTP
jgi:hypothetical protein